MRPVRIQEFRDPTETLGGGLLGLPSSRFLLAGPSESDRQETGMEYLADAHQMLWEAFYGAGTPSACEPVRHQLWADRPHPRGNRSVPC
jgi:hypothetical protein